MPELRYLDGRSVRAVADVASGVDALRAALASGAVNPELDSPRLFSPAPGGEFILMPAVGADYCGVKTVTIAPGNPAVGKPRVQGVYMLYRNDDLAPVVLMDAVELTLIRTAAVTLLALTELVRARGMEDAGNVVIVGSGPQADQHARAIATLLHPASLHIVGRRAQSAQSLVSALQADGIDAATGDLSQVREANVVVCVTSSTTPVLADGDVRADAVIAAVGSHGLDARELPESLVRRSDVVVEARASAMREGGNLIPARSIDEWRDHGLSNLQDLVAGALVLHPDRPAVYSGVGMAWEDLVIATDIHHRLQQSA